MTAALYRQTESWSSWNCKEIEKTNMCVCMCISAGQCVCSRLFWEALKCMSYHTLIWRANTHKQMCACAPCPTQELAKSCQTLCFCFCQFLSPLSSSSSSWLLLLSSSLVVVFFMLFVLFALVGGGCGGGGGGGCSTSMSSCHCFRPPDQLIWEQMQRSR